MSEDVLSSVSPDHWEVGFLSQLSTENFGPGEVVRAALIASGCQDVEGAIDSIEPEDEILMVLDNNEGSTVGIEFPESMHGDAIWVSFSRFPGGTAVGRVSDSWSGESHFFVVPQATGHMLRKVAEEMIYARQDGADWNTYEEGDETPSDGTPARLFGFEELLRDWPSEVQESNP